MLILIRDIAYLFAFGGEKGFVNLFARHGYFCISHGLEMHALLTKLGTVYQAVTPLAGNPRLQGSWGACGRSRRNCMPRHNDPATCMCLNDNS